MIRLTRLNGESFALNSDMIETIEETPDTIIRLNSKNFYVVKETMDEVCEIYCSLAEKARTDPEALHTAPHDTPVRRLDEVKAARDQVVRYTF